MDWKDEFKEQLAQRKKALVAEEQIINAIVCYLDVGNLGSGVKKKESIAEGEHPIEFPVNLHSTRRCYEPTPMPGDEIYDGVGEPFMWVWHNSPYRIDPRVLQKTLTRVCAFSAKDMMQDLPIWSSASRSAVYGHLRFLLEYGRVEKTSDGKYRVVGAKKKTTAVCVAPANQQATTTSAQAPLNELMQ